MKESDDAQVVELIEAAVRAGAYRTRARDYPAHRQALEAMADRFTARAATLASEIAMRAERDAQTFIAMPTTKR